VSRPTLVLLHGWGFAPDFWDTLAAQFPALLPDCDAVRLDMGFFGPRRLDLPDGPLVGVGHSLGFARLLHDFPGRFQALVSLGGFTRFPVAPGPVRAMRRGLARDANAVLTGFHALCGVPGHPLPEEPHAERLIQGLDMLLQWDLDAALDALETPLLALAAADDAVVSVEYARLRFAGRLTELSGGGHAFPITRAGECAAHIARFLERAWA